MRRKRIKKALANLQHEKNQAVSFRSNYLPGTHGYVLAEFWIALTDTKIAIFEALLPNKKGS